MSMNRRQFFTLMGAGAAATLLPLTLPVEAKGQAEKLLPNPTMRSGTDTWKPSGKRFRIVEVRVECFADTMTRTHVEAIEEAGWMTVAFDTQTELHLRPHDVIFIDMDALYSAQKPPVSYGAGKVNGIEELTLRMPSLAERANARPWEFEIEEWQ